VFPKWAWSRSREQFLHCELRKFRHSMSSVYRWYTQLDRHQFVYDTCKTMKATRTRHVWVHMFTTHRLTLTLQLHNFDLFRTCRTALLRGNWQDFNWHNALRDPSAIAEFLVLFWYRLTQAVLKKRPLNAYSVVVVIVNALKKLFRTKFNGLFSRTSVRQQKNKKKIKPQF